jgi:hypothetical protein
MRAKAPEDETKLFLESIRGIRCRRFFALFWICNRNRTKPDKRSRNNKKRASG